MKPFSIIITGASRPSLWYSNLVGVKMKAVSARWGERGIELETDSFGFVLWEDCELAPQPESAELSLLRRVAEAAYDVYSMRSWEPNTIIAKQRELLQALKAWKAGTK